MASISNAQDVAPALASSNPNEFVRQVQAKLKGADTYGGPISGTLDRRTIAAINDACREASVLPQCQLGPLSTEGAQAVVTAVNALTSVDEDTRDLQPAAPAEVTAPENDVAAETPGVSSVSVDTIAVEWPLTSSRNGIAITGEVSDNGYVASASGTALNSDWTNLESTGVIDAAPGEAWTFSMSAATNLSAGGTAVARVAVFGVSNQYLGELSVGAPISGADAQQYSVTGQVPEGAVRIRPYIQLSYPAGAGVDDTISISDAAVSK